MIFLVNRFIDEYVDWLIDWFKVTLEARGSLQGK